MGAIVRPAETCRGSPRDCPRRPPAKAVPAALRGRDNARDKLTTSRYWSGDLIHCQRLPAAAVVWQMGYDRLDRRWKMERLVQALPAGNGGVRVTLAVELPASVGRDY